MLTRNFIAIFVGILIEMNIPATLSQGWNDLLEDETASMPPPTFMDTPTEVTVKEGQMAKLECSLENLGTKNVIWRLKSAPNPLTIGRRTYVDDSRIMVDNQPMDPEWPLIIKQVKKEDAGEYECQVASRDKTIRRYVALKVKDPTRDNWKMTDDSHRSRGITMAGQTYVDNGHKIQLICNATSIDNGPPLQDLDWFFDGQKLTTDISKKRTIQKRVSLMDKTIDSVLEIESADMSNAGTYICRTSDLQVTSARVNVLNGTKSSGTSNVKRSRTDNDQGIADGTRSSQRGDQNGGEGGSNTNHQLSISTFSCCLVLSIMATGNLKRAIHYLKWLPA